MDESTKKKESIRQNVAFSAVGSLGTNIISLLGFILLARILSPHEYGLMAIVAIFTAFAAIIIELGMGSALIHNQQATQCHYSTAFWINLLMGIVFCVLLVVSAALIADFFDAEELVNVIRVSSLAFVFNSIAIVSFALIKKRKQFRHVAKTELVSVMCGLVVAVVMAYQGFGVWALVANLLVASAVRAGYCFVLAHWVPGWSFGWKEFVELWNYSGYLMGTNIFNYFSRNVDNILVGRLMGSQVLGAYKYAFQIAKLPAQIVNGIFHRVLFSSFSEYQHDKARIKAMYFKAIRLVAFFTFPAMLGLSAIADHFVLTVLGEKWSDMSIILSFLCMVFLIDSLGALSTSLFLSQGKTKHLFWLTAFLRSNLILGIVIGIQFGMEGLLWGLLIAKMVNFYPGFRVAGKAVGFQVSEFVNNVIGILASSLCMVAVVILLQGAPIVQPGSWLAFAILIVTGMVTYTFISLLFQRKNFHEVLISLKLKRQVL